MFRLAWLGSCCFNLPYTAGCIATCRETGNVSRLACIGDRGSYSTAPLARRSTSPILSAGGVTCHSVVPTTSILRRLFRPSSADALRLIRAERAPVVMNIHHPTAIAQQGRYKNYNIAHAQWPKWMTIFRKKEIVALLYVCL